MRARRSWAVSLGAGLLLASASASAQSPDLQNRAVAEKLFRDGTDAMARHDYAAACPKLEEVTKLLPGKIGAMFRLAACLEAWGKVTSAWAEYQIIASTAPAVDELKKASADKVAALEPKLPRLVVSVSAAARAAQGLEVKRDGVAVGPAQWGVALPVDPGPHEVTATAARKKAWRRSVDVTARAAATVEVPDLADEAPQDAGAPVAPAPASSAPASPVAASPAAPAQEASGAPAPPAAQEAQGGGARFRGGLSAGGGAGVFPGVAGVFGVGEVDFRLGVQFNDVIGLYLQPFFAIGDGSANGSSQVVWLGGGNLVIDFTIVDRLFIGVGGGGGVAGGGNGIGGSGQVRVRLGGYPIMKRGDDGVRRKGLMIGADLSIDVATGPPFVQPTLSIGYEAF